VALLAAAAAAAAACGERGALKEGKVLAVVNGSAITEAAFEREVAALPPYVRPIVESPAGRAQFLESLVTRDLLLQEALRRGIDARPEVRARIEMARRSIVLEALLREVAERAPGLSEPALRKYYEQNRAQFEAGERVGVRHLLFKEKERAEQVAERARRGESFEKLAGEIRADRGENSADLGLVERGRYIKEFEQAAFSARERSVVGPVRTAYGYHVLWVGERKAPGVQPFEEVREKIAAELRDQAQREAFERLVADLRRRSEVRIVMRPPVPEAPAERNLPAPGAPVRGQATRPAAPPQGQGR